MLFIQYCFVLRFLELVEKRSMP